jgi:hypothetical protein
MTVTEQKVSDLDIIDRRMKFGKHSDFNPMLGLSVQRSIKDLGGLSKLVVDFVANFYDAHNI